MYYVYVIQNEKDELYYGFTSDLKKRMREHNEGSTFSTRGFLWRLVYYEAYLSKKDAMTRERSMKRYGQALGHLKNRIKASLKEKR